MNKKGQGTIMLFTLIVVSLVLVILISAFLFFFDAINTSLAGNQFAGQVNMSEASENTIGKINDAFLSSSDLIGIFFLFGVVLAIMINGFLTRNSTPKLFFMIDFLIIIFAYILAVYVANAYEEILLAIPFTNLIAANLNNSSRFILFLPIITVVTGFTTMILTYAGIPRTRSEAEVAGF